MTMSTAEGLRLFMEGTRMLGQGMQAFGQQGRFKDISEGIKEEDEMGFVGGEMGKKVAAGLAREGQLSQAMQMRRPENLESMLNSLAINIADKNTPPEKKSELMHAFTNMSQFYKHINLLKSVGRGRGGGGGGGGGVAVSPPAFKDLAKYEDVLNGVESKPEKGFFDSQEEYDASVAQWNQKQKQTIQNNINKYMVGRTPDEKQYVYDSLSNNFLGTALSNDVDGYLDGVQTAKYKQFISGPSITDKKYRKAVGDVEWYPGLTETDEFRGVLENFGAVPTRKKKKKAPPPSGGGGATEQWKEGDVVEDEGGVRWKRSGNKWQKL